MKSILIPGIFVLVGAIGLFFAAHFGWKAIKLSDTGIKVQGRVIDIQEERKKDSDGRYRSSYVSTIEFYTKSGSRFETQQSGKNQIGAHVKLIYDSQDPKNASIDSFAAMWLMPIFSLLFASIFIGLGGYHMHKAYARKKEIEWLFQHGTRIRAKVVGVKEHINHDDDNGSRHRRVHRHYQIVCEYNGNGHGAKRFVSDQVARDPGDDFIGKEVDVIIDNQNPDVFYVDVETL